MSLLSDLENDIINGGHHVEEGLTSLAALIYGDLKQAAAAAEEIVAGEVKAMVPAMAAKLKDYAELTVKAIAADPLFAHAIGSWKFGAAAARVMSLMVADFGAPAAQLGAASVETAVQSAFAAMVVGAIAAL